MGKRYGVGFFVSFIVQYIPQYFAKFYMQISKLPEHECIRPLDFQTIRDFEYFSYTTFTTLGYGDYKPVGVCRAIATTEAVLGYICLGVLTGLFFRVLSILIPQPD